MPLPSLSLRFGFPLSFSPFLPFPGPLCPPMPSPPRLDYPLQPPTSPPSASHISLPLSPLQPPASPFQPPTSLHPKAFHFSHSAHHPPFASYFPLAVFQCCAASATDPLSLPHIPPPQPPTSPPLSVGPNFSHHTARVQAVGWPLVGDQKTGGGGAFAPPPPPGHPGEETPHP